MMKKRMSAGLIALVLLTACFIGCGDDSDGGSSTYTVTFDSQGGSDVPSLTGIKSGSKIEKPTPNPTNGALGFDGWFKDLDFSNEWDFDTDTVTKNITLYAKFATRFTVTFNTNGGSNVPAITDARRNFVIAKPADPIKAGDVTFFAWYKEEALTTEWKFATDKVTGNMTLYAKYTSDAIPTDLARAEKVTLANAWYVVYQFTIPPGKTKDNYNGVTASYAFTETALENGVARGARLMGPYKENNFGMCMGTDNPGDLAPGKGVAIPSYNLANGPWILHNSSSNWGKEWKETWTDPADDWHLTKALTADLGTAAKPAEWFTFPKYTIDGKACHAEMTEKNPNALNNLTETFYFGLGLPGQGAPEDQGAHSNTFYIRDVKLLGNTGTTDVLGKAVYFKKDGYEYPAFTGYFNLNGTAGHKEAAREIVDTTGVLEKVVVDVTWENPADNIFP